MAFAVPKPYKFTLSAGALPAGLKLTAAGKLKGKPSAPGTATFTVTATDRFGVSGIRAYVVTVN